MMSRSNPQALDFLFAQAPEHGVRQAVVAGIDWVRLPLPFALNHVNCWYLHDDADTCVIDTGVHDNATLAYWNAVVSDMGWPQQLLVTHFHPDHSGLAGLFAKQGAQVFSSEIEWGIIERLNTIAADDYQAIYIEWYERNGVPQLYLDAVHASGNTYTAKTLPPPQLCDFLQRDQHITLAGRDYRVLIGQGHSPDMLMLYCEDDKLLIAADQVLPSITPNVSLMPHTPDENPLASFLSCLQRLSELPEETLVLPSHGLPFTGLHHRLRFLQDHHQQRLDEVLHALNREQCAAELFSVLFKRKLDHQQMSFALGETLAHLRYLENQSRISVNSKNGVDYFCAI